ncbi:MAG: hypothetical protein WCI74_16740, partial [Actinomycetes bacterium]
MNTFGRFVVAVGASVALVGTPLVSAVSSSAIPPPALSVAAPAAPAAPAAGIAPTTRGDVPDRSARRIARIMARMTLADKVGQLFVQEFAGQDADNPDAAAAAVNMQKYGVSSAAQLVTKYHLGGVIYFTNNTANPGQVAGLSDALQRAALSAAPRVPLAIRTDQE